jgi:hypothetical protein
VVVDGRPGPEFEEGETRGAPVVAGGAAVFSPDSQHVAYAARQGATWLVIVDGQPRAACDGVLDGSSTFTADDVLEYRTRKGGATHRITGLP